MAKPVSARLLDAGLKLFANRGYAGTPVQEIIDEAGVTKPTLYYYFQNKAGLFQALVDRALDERLQLMRRAAPPGKETAEQLTDILAAVSELAARKPDHLRLCFAIAFAAPGEFPADFRKHDKMIETYLFLREIVTLGLKRGVFSASFHVDELTLSYFHLVQASTALSTFQPRAPRKGPPVPLPPKMSPRRIVELFIGGAAGRKAARRETAPRKTRAPARAALLVALLGFSSAAANAQSGPQAATNYPSADTTPPPVMSDEATNNAAVTPTPAVTNSAPDLADQRAVPPVVKASRPDLALASPVADNARDPLAVDLQTCFQLTAVRDDSLKISLQDVRVAQAQMSQSIAALWPTFTATNQQEFIHYINPNQVTGFNIVNGSTQSNLINYTSESNVNMTWTLFNGGQNWNKVGASSAAIAAKRETLARDYQTIYQDVAQAFYNVLEFQGDLAIQRDLVDALAARVDDLKGRVSLGRSRPSELLQAQTDLANARVTIQSDLGSDNAALETLAFYTGIPAAQLKLKDTQKFPSVEQLEYYLAHSGDRPDVLSQVQSLREAQRNLDAAWGELLPTVTAQGQYLASQDPVSNNIDGTMILQMSMPIFDGGLIAGQIHENHELVRQSALNVEQLKRTADQDTRTAYVNFNASAAQVVVLREATVLAAKNLEAQVEDYRRGVVDNLDVLTALQDYQTARQALHNANMTTRLDLINLHVAAGLAATGPNVNNQALPTVTGTAH
jgi:outer membrane protein TolC/AcrR family transcriptional regulator